MENDEGVLILCLGHAYYGNMATQLARSIKHLTPNVNITCAYYGDVLSHNRELPFDQLVEVPKEYFTTEGMPDFVKAKTYLYELSPYKKTIFIDADVIWLPQKPITDLFNEFKDTKITFANRGKEKLSEAKDGFLHWAKPSDIKSVYGEDGWLYNLASEFIYWQRDKKIAKFFKTAQEVYSDPKIPYKKFGTHLPDELAFEIALIKTKIELHASPFVPFYWEQFERKAMKVQEMYTKYFGYSLGGNVNTGQVANIYNNLANHYNRKFGINGYFPAKDKRSWLPERRTL
jgi:hypothetical protein